MNTLQRQFVWTTQDGEEMTVDEMKTSHLFFSLRMIWNHTAPEAFRIPGCKRYNGPDQWPAQYRRNAVVAFITELNKRNDLPAWMATQLQQIKNAAGSILRGRLTHSVN